jgi:hypothetical protein
VGRDLSTVSLPAVFNEPLSLLQRAAEDMTYCNLIDAVRDLLFISGAF